MVDSLERKILSFYKSKKILVSGATGYIAWNLINKLLGIDCQITCLTRNPPSELYMENFTTCNAEVKTIVGSYDDEALWKKSMDGVDIVFHLAAQTSFYKAEEDPLEDFNSNVYPMQLLLKVVSQNEKKPYIAFAGSATQCGLTKKLPVGESVNDNPSTIYDFHKLLAESYLKFYINKNMVNGACLRLSNVYGPGPKSTNDDRGILNSMVRKALHKETLTIYGAGDFTRDYIFIDDVVNAFLACPCHLKRTNGNYYIVGSGKGYSVKEAINMVARVVERITSLKVNVISVEPPDGLLDIEYRHFFADNSNLKLDTGWFVSTDLEEGIVKTVNKFKTN
jgi:nucleoside-diphosphate-sugar epimerase